MISDYILNGNLKVVIRPKSSKNSIRGWDESRKALIVNIHALPEDGKANKELVRFISRELKQRVEIKSGFTSREKVLRIF
jgi:uncharacterized protein